MKALAFVAVLAVLAVAACNPIATPVASRVSPSPSPARFPASTQTPTAPPAASPSPAPPASPSPTPPMPVVQCVRGSIPSFEALVTGTAGTLLYDVGDPLHPRATCRIANTPVHILTGTSFEYLVPNVDGTTSVVLHSLGSNNDSVVATVQADLYHIYFGWAGSVAWLPGTDKLAYLAGGGTDAQGFGVTDVWLATSTSRTKIYSYSVPGKDAFGRPGFAPVTLDFSPDGAYLAAGWSVALSPVRVFRLADRADVSPALPADFRFAFWAKAAATLYIVAQSGVSQWTPGGAPALLPGTPAWTLDPSLSPGGTQVAFTVVTTARQVRTYVYDLPSGASRLITDQPRSSAMFVKTGWVWEVEEKPCVPGSGQNCFDPTVPDGTVLAFEVATGHETAVAFAAGESPTAFGLSPGDLWPRT